MKDDLNCFLSSDKEKKFALFSHLSAPICLAVRFKVLLSLLELFSLVLSDSIRAWLLHYTVGLDLNFILIKKRFASFLAWGKTIFIFGVNALDVI